MNSKQTVNKSRHTRLRAHLSPRSLNYYLKVPGARKKIGNLATRSFFQVRELLTKEIGLSARTEMSDGSAESIAWPYTINSTDDQNKPVIQSTDPNEATREEIKTIVRQSHEIMAEATTIFPLTLFPDTITLDRRKLTFTQRNFFWSSKTLSIQVEEILNITANVGPFFGSLHIAIRGLTSQDHFSVNYLWRKDAIHMKHMIQGYVIALKDHLKLENLDKEEVIETLSELGHDTNPQRV